MMTILNPDDLSAKSQNPDEYPPVEVFLTAFSSIDQIIAGLSVGASVQTEMIMNLTKAVGALTDRVIKLELELNNKTIVDTLVRMEDRIEALANKILSRI